ncbi:hypothetical protein FRC17_007314 [Serendipita sp. 399]|nr:hypothetical protein FRC17_007314 [Serendipita sp. 399]
MAGALVAQAGITLVNYTLDDNDASISYSGTWQPASTHPSPLNYGGTHTLGVSNNAQAVFTFTGVAVYYLASLWPYKVDSYISLDGGPRQLVDMTAPSGTTRPSGVNIGDEVANYDVRWKAENLANTTHTLTITQGPSTFAVSDGFRYTVAFNNEAEDEDPTTLTLPLPIVSSENELNSLTTTVQTPLTASSGNQRNPFVTAAQTAGSANISNGTTSTSGLSTTTTGIITGVASVLGTCALILGCFLCWRRCCRDDDHGKYVPANGMAHVNDYQSAYGYNNYSYNDGRAPVNNNGHEYMDMPMPYNGIRPVSQGYQPVPTTMLPPGVVAPSPHPHRVEYHDIGPHPVNPALNMNAPAAAMESVTTLHPLRQ